MILAAVLVCTKFNNDIYFGNSAFALASGISLAEMNCIKHYCLTILDFDLFITEEEYAKYGPAMASFIDKELAAVKL